MIYLLYRPGHTRLTGKRLARALRANSGHDPGNCDNIECLIRWGSTLQVEEPDKTLNRQKSVATASDKLRTLEILADKGISVPQVVRLVPNIKLPWVGLARSRTHSGGNDIYLCLQNQDIAEAVNRNLDYLVQYIPTVQEFRYHIFKNRSIKVSEKVLTNRKRIKPFIRNLSTGYTFRVPDKVHKEARKMAKRAVSALELDFGAVDVVISDDNRPFVLEVNTGPGLIPSGIKKYATKIAKEFGLTVDEDYIRGLEE